MPRYSIHGLCVESPTELAAVPFERRVERDHEPEPDVRVQPWTVDAALFDALRESAFAAPHLIDRVFPTRAEAPLMRAISAEQAGCWLTSYFDRVLFRFDREQRTLERVVRSNGDIAFGDMLQAGSYWAALCTLRGRIAHHASAVDLPELGTVVVVARAGQGKSSTAASLVLAGGHLRSDDVVTLVRDASGFACEPGSLLLRMRQPIAGELPDTLKLDPRDSGDGRHVYRGSAALSETQRVRALLFPHLSDAEPVVRIEKLAPLEGFRAIAQEPRVAGVQSRDHHVARVAELTALCGSVPLARAHLPFMQRDLASQGRELVAWLRASLTVCA